MNTLRYGSHAPCVAGAAMRQRRALAAVRSFPPTWTTVKPAESRESPFRDLELMEVWDGIGRTRVRQHVNPFNLPFQQPTPAPDWPAVFADPSLPLALDIGSGYGRFLMLLQRNNPQQPVNYLGLEIRKPIVDRANEWAVRLGQQDRLHYIFTNATVSLQTLLRDYPGAVSDVFIQFPDPHFKRRHHKRRVVQPQLVAALRDLMPAGGRLLLQSDVEEVAVAMRNMFEKYGGDAFELAPQHRECAVFYSPDRPAGHMGRNRGEGKAAGPVTSPTVAEREPACQAAAASMGDGLQTTPRQSAAALEESTSSHAAAMIETATAADGVRSSSDKARQGPGDALADPLELDGTAGGSSSGSEEDEAAEGGGAGVSHPRDGDSGEEVEDEDIANMVSEWARGGWLADNPVGTPTEREHYVTQQGLPVYRVALVRRGA